MSELETGGAAPDAAPAPEASAPAEAASPPTMEQTIRETYRELTGAKDAAGDDAGEGEQKPARVRGPDGKFVKATPDAASAPEAAQDGTETPPEGEGTDPAAAPPSPYDAYPNTWRKEMQAEWQKLPPQVREEIHRREQNFLDGIRQYREPAAFGQAVGNELLPHLDTFRALGTTPVAAVREMVGTWAALQRGSAQERANILASIAQNYGIDMASLANRDTAASGGAPAFNPENAALSQELQAVRQRLERFEQQQEAALAADANSEIERFQKDRPHFAEVRAEMAALLRSGAAETLADAYDKAVWSVPAVRDKLLAEREAQQRKRDAEQAAAARKAAAANVTRRGTPPVAPKAGTMEDTIRNTLRQMNASG